jgi:hypothetical protein
LWVLSLRAQQPLPTVRLIAAPRVTIPGLIDSSFALTWDRIDGASQLLGVVSWGGVPARLAGSALENLQRSEAVSVVPHPGYGVWMESVVADESGAWYGYYHHEIPADVCGRPDRSILRIGAARSADRGLTWEDLGFIVEPSAESLACRSSNRYVLGGVGDVSTILDAERQNLFLFFSQYPSDPAGQGVAVARLAWADRDDPRGRVMVWQKGAWIPPRRIVDAAGNESWEYPAGTPLEPATRPWHDTTPSVDAFWGPAVHWNTYLEQYVLLVDRAKDENFNSDGVYVSFTRTLDRPETWTAPRKIMNGGGWYPQVAGLEAGSGTDKVAGQRARFFLTGRSDHYIEFYR